MQAKKTILPFIFFTFLLCTTCSFSQTRKIDSLKSALLYAKEDTNKFRLYYNIAGEYWIGLKDTIDYPNTYKYEDSAIQLARKLNYTYGIFDALMCYGNVYAYQAKLADSKRYYVEAIEYAEKLGNQKLLADTYFEIANNFFGYGMGMKFYAINFPVAIDYFFKSLKQYESVGDRKRMADCWLTISRVYAWQTFFNLGNGNVNEIENCATKALLLYRECNTKSELDIATSIFMWGRANYFKGAYTNALNLFNVALKKYKDSSDQQLINLTYLNIGRTYKGIGDSAASAGNKIYAYKMYGSSIQNLDTGLKYYTIRSDYAYMGLSCLYIGATQIVLNQIAEAKINIQKAIYYTDKLDGAGSYQEMYQCLAKIDSAEGNYRLALLHTNMYSEYIKNSFNNASIFETLNYQLQFEFDKKEDSLKQKQIVAETRLVTEKKQKYFYWTGLGLLSLLSFLGYRNFQNQKKINRLAADAYAKERTELELQSLRAQLNPHFIFNCINSIDAFIHSNDKYNATVYLNKFARLLRNILDSSKLTTVSFAKDIDTLKLYVELEELRHENKFRTEFSIDDGLLINDYKVPALIIQPIVENAILHGLKNREDNNGFLQIEIRKIADKIEYSIKDNGIGRKAAGLIAQNKESSYGMQMSYDRIKLFNKEEKPSVEITDLYKDGIAAGTEVKVLLNII